MPFLAAQCKLIDDYLLTRNMSHAEFPVFLPTGSTVTLRHNCLNFPVSEKDSSWAD